jgi:Tol biopolymer transport system component
VIAYLGKATIYVINADGSHRQRLLTGAVNTTFNWSPDGQQIAFSAGAWTTRAGKWEIDDHVSVANADGTGVHRLTPTTAIGAQTPTWAPNSQRLAFMAMNVREDHWRIYTINSDGTGLRLLTHNTGGKANFDGDPDWSPDGRWIVFERWTRGNLRTTAVMAIRPDGTGLHQIAVVITGPQCACPDWSPDGTKIAYQASPTLATAKYPEIYVMNANGSHPVRLTHHPARDENPDWSPDGTQIAFYSERPGNAEIYVMDADGSHLRRVTHDPWYSSFPRWLPTG